MIPLRDNIPSRTVPLVNYAIIAICGIVFLTQLAEDGAPGSSLVERFALIPARLLNPEAPVVVRELVPVRGQVAIVEREAPPPSFSPWLTLLTSMFLHGGWMHFLGNMWFLFIFGDNVEDRMGHLGYLLFYVFSGVAASIAHCVSGPASTIPTIGASGAIAGVMGAYFLLYPRALVLSVVPLFVFLEMVVLPAPVFLGVWFVIQFFQGAASITSTQAGGVAWWAHIGGFVVGYLLAALLRAAGETRPAVERVRPYAERVGAYRYVRR